MRQHVSVRNIEATVIGAAKLEHVLAHVVRRDDVLSLVAALVHSSVVVNTFVSLSVPEVRRVLHSLSLGCHSAIVIDLGQPLAFLRGLFALQRGFI